MTDYWTKEKFVADALLSGNGYATQVFDRSGRVERLAALPYKLMAIQLSSDAIEYRYSDPLSGQQTVFAPDDLAILKISRLVRPPLARRPAAPHHRRCARRRPGGSRSCQQ